MTCGACLGSGHHAHFPARMCDYCGGSGLRIDECRLELVDLITDTLSDACDLDVTWHMYAVRVLEALERRGLDPTALAELAA
ncbi:MAG TPA: hypothetical protein VIY51_01815 [Xanthobacteraceae bacterium]